jgi:hypothetical protein
MTEVAEAARRVVLDHLLALSVWAPGADGLVLRGSMPMAGWYLGRARPPGDLDWLVVGGAGDGRWSWSLPLYGSLDDLARDLPEDQLEPPSDETSFGALQTGREHLRPAGFRAEHRRHWEHATAVNPPLWLTDDEDGEPDTDPAPPGGLLEMVRAFPVLDGPTGKITLDPDRATTTGLWGYYGPGGAGVRLTIPWRADGLPDAVASCDFAQQEVGHDLVGEPVLTAIPRGDGGWPTTVRTVDRALSLAWKLQWLHTDNQPDRIAQGKDLYDAVLLAEDPATDLTLPHLRTVFEPAWHHTTGGPKQVAEWIHSWQLDWDTFQATHPQVAGTATDWLDRLADALSRRWWPGRGRHSR